MDIETLIKWEKNKLFEERKRLQTKQNDDRSRFEKFSQDMCPVDNLMKENPNFALNCVCVNADERKSETSTGASEKNADRAQLFSSKVQATSAATTKATPESSMTTARSQLSSRETVQMPALEYSPVGLSSETFSLYAHNDTEQENGNACKTETFTKSDKDLANRQTSESSVSSAVVKHGNSNSIVGKRVKRKDEDDMEQWVTDTFYSYFPGFNDELQKRQRYLRERQQENQKNLIKHQLTHPPLPRNALHRGRRFDSSHQTVNTARSASTTTTNTNSSTMSTHPTNKTDLEIIVNNPGGYVPPKQHTPRNKLLQDLRHTELSNMIGADGATERNRHTAELASARKKDYQRELMQQIEEKRRSIEVLREKERRQEEILTRRLQEQLRTIQLEEELEKEKMRADKARFDSEQSRLMREHLLAKLESDTKLLRAKSKSRDHETKKRREPLTQGPDKAPGTATTAEVGATGDGNDNNKVYKYFSNSARHEYRRGKPLPEELELDLNFETLNEIRNSDELECFHLSEKVCPMCDAPLKSYESCCLRCQKKLSIRMHARRNAGATTEKGDKTNGNQSPSQANQDDSADNSIILPDEESYSMVCEKCERLYGLCPTCLAQNEVCRACHRKRNVCMSCRRTLCTRCLDEIANGRDTERNHVNENEDRLSRRPVNKNDSDSVRSFHVLEVNYGAPNDDNKNAAPNLNFIQQNSNESEDAYNDGLPESSPTEERPPYSMSIERNSIFHPDYNPVKQTTSFEKLDSMPIDEHWNMERVRKDTDNRLSRYLRNYGDLAINPRTRSRSDSGQDRSTQTTPNTAARRDVVMHEEHNLSMPLLREMPKMTRLESNRLQLKKPAHVISNRIEQLKRRWEIPAVQKFTISSTQPKVLTQIGAIRKQLQADHILQDELDDND